MFLNTKLYITYDNQQLNITKHNDLFNMHIKYKFTETSHGYGKRRTYKHTVNYFDITCYDENKNIIYEQNNEHFDKIYNEEVWFRLTEYVEPSKFIKLAINDSLAHITK